MTIHDASKEADVIAWAIRACAPNATPDDMGSLRHAVEKLLAGQRAGAYGQCPRYGSALNPCRDECASGTCAMTKLCEPAPDPFTWVRRTWVDVREGDVIRPPGIEGAEAKVVAIGPVVAWGVNDIQPLDAYQQRDIQYNPGKYAGTYAVRRATFHPIDDPASATTREMKPDAPVDIRVTLAELKAIEALGGWANRVAVIDNQE